MGSKTISTIGGRIQSLREENGLSQAELAKELNVKQQTINQWENGERDIKTGSIIALSKYFNVSADYILCISDYKKPENTPITNITGLSDNTISVIKELNIKYITNPINILCGDNLPENPGKSAVQNFFDLIMMYYLYMADAKEQPEEMGVRPTESGIILPFKMAAEFLLQTSIEYFNLIIKNSMGVLPYSDPFHDSTSILSYKIFLQKLLKAKSYPDERQYQIDFENFDNTSKEWKEKIKDGSATESEYLEWLQKVKESDTNGND